MMLKKKIITGLAIALCLILAMSGIAISDYVINGKKYSEADMLLGLARAWRYGYEFNAVLPLHPELDWDARFMEYADKILDTKYARDYWMEIAEFATALEDAHIDLIDLPAGLQRGYLPVQMKYVEDKIIATQILGGGEDIPLFSKLVKVDGIPAEEYIKSAKYKWNGNETPYADKQARVAYMLNRGWVGETRTFIFISPDGVEIEREFEYLAGRSLKSLESATSIMREKLGIAEIHKGAGFTAYEYESGIFQIVVPDFTNNSLYASFDRFLQSEKDGETVEDRSKGFILDLRNNTGGNSMYAIDMLSRFVALFSLPPTRLGITDVSLLMAAKASRHLAEGEGTMNTSSYLMLGDRYNYVASYFAQSDKIGKKVKKPVIMLINERCVSSGEAAADLAKASSEILVIGKSTEGASGTVAFCQILDGVKMGFSTQRVYNYDGVDVTGNGIQPEIWVEQSYSDILEFEDSCLNKAIELIDLKLSDYTAYEKYVAENLYDAYSLEFGENIGSEEAATLAEVVAGQLRECGDNDGVLTIGEKVLGLAEIWRRAAAFYPGWDSRNGSYVYDMAFKKYVMKAVKAGTIDDYYRLLEEFIAILGDNGSLVEAPGQYRQSPVAAVDGMLPIASYGSFSLYDEGGVYRIAPNSLTDSFAADFGAFISTHDYSGGIILDLRGVIAGCDLYDANLITNLFVSTTQMKYKIQLRDVYTMTEMLSELRDNDKTIPLVSTDPNYWMLVNANTKTYPVNFSGYTENLRMKYRGKLAVIIDEQTSYNSEVIAEYVKGHEGVTVIGQKSSGICGPYVILPLPEGGRFRVTTAFVEKNNGSSYVSFINNNGVEPDIFVEGAGGAAVSEAKRALANK